jgi:hypothetical protein
LAAKTKIMSVSEQMSCRTKVTMLGVIFLLSNKNIISNFYLFFFAKRQQEILEGLTTNL